MQDMIESTLSYLKRLQKRYVFTSGELIATVAVEKPIALAPPPLEIIIKTAPPPKPIEIKQAVHVPKKPKVELAPLKLQTQTVPLQKSLLEQIGITPLDPMDDGYAKKVRFAYKDKKHVPEIPILLCGNAYKPFLDNVAKAIGNKFGTSRVLNCDALEAKKKWDVLKESENIHLFILPDFVLAQFPILQDGFLENGNQRMLFGKPLLLLPDLSLYIKDPELKRSLWNILCTMLNK